MFKSFRTRLLAGERLAGVFVTLGIPEAGEILAAAGFDWLCIDAEHAPLSPLHVQRIIQGAGQGAACLVRVASATETAVKQALDTGAAGIIVPMVNSAETARQVVYWSRYAPEGGRGVGLARAHGYGRTFSDYMDRANAETVVVVQAEQREAVERIADIVAVPGLDAVFVGPYDLSASLGYPGDVTHPEVTAAIEHVFQTCRAAGKPLGIFGLNAAAVQAHVRRGFTLIAAGVDVVLLGESAASLARAVRQVPDGTEEG